MFARVPCYSVTTKLAGSLTQKSLDSFWKWEFEQMKRFASHSLLAVVLVSCVRVGLAQDDASGTPLEEVTQEMKVATNHLSRKTTDKQTQRPQEEAVTKIDKLIAALEKQRKALGGGINNNPSMPANASTIRKGPGGMGDLHGAKEQGNRWGELPPHERDRILQSLTEGFPTHYQAILEAYYKRLAVEKKTDEGDSLPEESTRDAASEPSSSTNGSTTKSTSPATTTGQ